MRRQERRRADVACCLLSAMAALRGWLVAGTAAAQTRHCHSKGTQPLHSFTVAAGPPSNAVASLGSTASELCCFQTIGLCCIVSRSRLNVIVALLPPPPLPLPILCLGDRLPDRHSCLLSLSLYKVRDRSTIGLLETRRFGEMFDQGCDKNCGGESEGNACDKFSSRLVGCLV